MQNIATLSDPSLFTDRCLVGGKWIAAETGAAIEVTNPATGEVLGGVPNCGRKETDEAIAAAARAFGPWSRRTAADRAALLERWHDLVLHSMDDLALLMTLEQGKPLGESRGEVSYGASFIKWFMPTLVQAASRSDARFAVKHSQALYSDIVLPSAHWYEKTDLNVTEEHTFINMTEPAIAPQWESKTDWQIFKLLARKVQEAAIAKGHTKFFDEQFKWSRDLATLEAQYTDNAKFDSDEAAAQFILDSAPQSKGITLDQLREKPQRFKGNWTSPMKEGVPYTPFQFFAVNKRPWPTLTGRQQYYIDHEVFFSMGVELPVYKPPIDADKYPLRFNTPHSRHAIHSTFKDNELMLRLQRGGPMVEVPPAEAEARGLKDNDWAEIFNDHGRVIVRIKIKAGEQIGRISMYHTPELYMDLIEGSSQSVCPIRITPTHLVGNYGHLLFRPNYYGPGGSQRDTRVEMRKYIGAVPIPL